MDCIEEEKADEKSGEEIKRERMTDENAKRKESRFSLFEDMEQEK